uniref:transposase n=1 Tax=Chryseobacterium echinoideorum TaxID=1549648 RepID=UPI003743C998
HKTFKNIAQKGQCSLGWFYGFKLHLIINDKGEVLDFILTTGNVDDREPLKSMDLHKCIFGKLFGDKGYIGKDLFEQLFIDRVHLIMMNKEEYEKFFNAFTRQNYAQKKSFDRVCQR